MNGSEGGWILYFQVRREVKAIREDCPPEFGMTSVGSGEFWGSSIEERLFEWYGSPPGRLKPRQRRLTLWMTDFRCEKAVEKASVKRL
ncbi:hypothetical protein L6452_22554 [Arctium lappa]|uniref:Uncharacterized protein n=1 Tax=Arctium lappa TaxID=4217 RepID=A0ACB9B0W8_ARCLA|nr:hypothetical protein L6452_22554 [Arctium lappa]